MTHVLLERDFDPPINEEALVNMAAQSFPCMQIYNVEWRSSFLAPDGSRMYCHFEAPDTEALRQVMRTTSTLYRNVYACEVMDSDNKGSVCIMVERSWESPVEFEEIAKIEEEKAWCLEAHDVTFLRSYFSQDQKRMICLYQAPDAESVRQSQTKAGMPFDEVWAFQHVTPEFLAPLMS